jgi:hypothetical protein
MRARLDLDGEFSVDQVPDVRRFTERMALALDMDTRSRVSMAAHELFENAIKFSNDGHARLHVQIEQSPFCVSIVTTNRTDHQNRQTIVELSERMASASPMEHYLRLMKSSQRGGLGIGRVAAEAEMHVTIEVVDNIVTVKARLE